VIYTVVIASTKPVVIARAIEITPKSGLSTLKWR
jgi:hypothetical protein